MLPTLPADLCIAVHVLSSAESPAFVACLSICTHAHLLLLLLLLLFCVHTGDVGTNIWSSGSNGATANSENAVQPGSSSNSSSTAHASQPDSSQQAPDAQAKFVSVATGM